MKRAFLLRLAAAALAAGAAGLLNPSAAQATSDGRLAVEKILPPHPGRNACYRRLYDARHLEEHPRQTITEMVFLLRVDGYNAKGDRVFANPDHVAYQFALALKRRGGERPLRTDGECSGDSVAGCFVDCDGGGVTIEPSSRNGGLTVRLQGEGIAFGNDCDTTRGVFVGPGADDKVFELSPQPFASCQSLEKETLGP